jgi:hypothetical protein
MPATATIASKPAAQKSRGTIAGRSPGKTVSGLSAGPPLSARRATALPAFVRSGLTPQGPDSSRRKQSITDKTSQSKPLTRLAPLAPGRESTASGQPLLPHVKEAIEKSLSIDLSSVRVHSGATAQETAEALSAKAFTFGSQIVLGKGAHPSDLGLIAHEAAHVIQQQAAPALQKWSADRNDRFEREADRASLAVQRGESFTVRERLSAPRVQRLGLSDALNYIADKANIIPGFRMFTIILGVNPINMSPVDRSAANILRALIEFLPGGGLIVQALENAGVFEKVGNWVDQQIRTLGVTGTSIKQALTQFLDSLHWSDIFDLGGVWERAKHIFSEPIDRIINFAKGLVTGIIQFIKDAILHPIAKLAEGTAGYDLLKAVLGKDPITDEPYALTPENVIGPFMRLIHEEEIWDNMKKANAIPRAWAWFQGALKGLMGFVRQIPTLFMNAFKALELEDIILVPRAFAKLANVFGGFLEDFISWAGTTTLNLLEIICDVISPGAFSYIKKTGAALKSILKNPLPFVGNLVKAAKLGFQNFADNFGAHLKAGLIDWLTGSLPGVYIPKAFELGEIVKFVFSVLGISWQNIRQKLVKVVGEPAVKAMEIGFDIVVTLVTQGPAAAWDKIKEQLANLKDMVIGGIIDFVIDMVVHKAVPKIVAMFIPGAGFISAILSIYDAIMVFVNKIKQIAQVVTAFVDSIVAIASGAIAAAAGRVESTLAGLLSLAINFLAGFAGLGKVADKVMGVINKVRATIDKAIDWLVNWIVTMAKKLFAKVFGKEKDGKPDERSEEEKLADLKKAVSEGQPIASDKTTSRREKQKNLEKLKKSYRLTNIELVSDQLTKDKEKVHVRAVINPTFDGDGFIIDAFPPQPTVIIVAWVQAPLPTRPKKGAEEILERPTAAGLGGFQRAHLLGPGLGYDAPQGLFYAPKEVNQELQNQGIEQLIREMYAKRYPGAEFQVQLTAIPHPGTEILAKANYKLYGRLPGEPLTWIFEYTINIGLGSAPSVEVLAGEPPDMTAANRLSSGMSDFIRRRAENP